MCLSLKAIRCAKAQGSSYRFPRVVGFHFFRCTLEGLSQISKNGNTLPLGQVNQVGATTIVVFNGKWCELQYE